MVEETAGTVSGENSNNEIAQNGQVSPQGTGDVNLFKYFFYKHSVFSLKFYHIMNEGEN